jgi:hypothetical protein
MHRQIVIAAGLSGTDFGVVPEVCAGTTRSLAIDIAKVRRRSSLPHKIRDWSRRGGLVLDPFAGSGTTPIAAEKTGRKATAIEFSPIRVDAAIRRWQGFTGKPAIHADTGTSFVELEQHRAAAASARHENDR